MQSEKKSYTYEEIRQKLMYYCAYQDRCHYEVEQKMRDFLLIPEARDELLLYLMKENYLNEERFTRSYIRGKFSIKQWGRNKIRIHLKQKQVPEKLIQSCFDEINQSEYRSVIRKLYESYFSKQKGLKDYQKKIKTSRYLMSRGFEYEEILSAVNDAE
ncbi:MAG: regulatory protein RecX [Bergeyella sp.]